MLCFGRRIYPIAAFVYPKGILMWKYLTAALLAKFARELAD